MSIPALSLPAGFTLDFCCILFSQVEQLEYSFLVVVLCILRKLLSLSVSIFFLEMLRLITLSSRGFFEYWLGQVADTNSRMTATW